MNLVYTHHSMADTPQSNPFAIFDLPPRFDLDASAIERSYLSKLATIHPDVGEGGNGPDAAELNRARVMLLDGEQRANALLEILGGPSASACKDLPDGFLMEMMTRRQEIEEQVAEAGDQSRGNWETWAREERAQYMRSAAELFEALDEMPNPKKLVEIRMLLNAWRYIERLIEQLDPEYDPEQADFR